MFFFPLSLMVKLQEQLFGVERERERGVGVLIGFRRWGLSVSRYPKKLECVQCTININQFMGTKRKKWGR
jgi:hypothetical protein